MRTWLNMVAAMLLMSGCAGDALRHKPLSNEYAAYFEIIFASEGTPEAISVISPYDSHRDTLYLDEPADNIICMSSSHVAALAAAGADSVITAVSGIRYISNPVLRSRYPEELQDIGYESSLDYEVIVKLRPDLLLTYTISGSEPPYIKKLRSLDIPVLVLHDHLEEHPLARAEYVRLFGALTGRLDMADSVFASVRDRYESLAAQTVQTGRKRMKALLNIPYGDAWYIPGNDNYMSRLIHDAGGTVLGAESGTSVSKVVSMEEAYRLSQKADIWLNPGHCRTRRQLEEIHQLFPSFGPMADGLPIYNNTLRTTPEGGNDFWESGAMRPDLILEDLVKIFSGAETADTLNYFYRLD